MRFRTWPVAAVALGGLLLLVVVSVLTASQKAQQIYTQLDELNQQYHQVETNLRRLRSDVHLSGIFVRDYLLDAARERAPEYRERLEEFRSTNTATFLELRELMQRRGENAERLAILQAQLDEYWKTLDPLFDWTPAEKLNYSAGFLRREVLPRREAVLEIAEEIEALNSATLSAQRADVTARQSTFRRDLFNLLWRTLLLGGIVAITAVIRLRVLERRSEEQRSIAQEAEGQMRQLSHQLVAAQEEERKNLSRELHDHVGQVLTALRMELGRIERLRVHDDRIGLAVAECRQLVDSMVRTVRDLALGLRPSMLDDFGLQPALEWHVRDFTRRSGLAVDLEVSGDLVNLPDAYRTCVYRVTQEALTNCVRHASATRVAILVSGDPHRIEVTVTDDGVGLEPERRRAGLGLRGIEERVRDLHGTVSIDSGEGKGTTLRIKLPLARPAHPAEVALARAAG
jgi:signal transduction histidine kinase